MSAVISETAGELHVKALVNYTRNTGVRPVNYTYDPPPGVPRNSGEADPRRVTIRNARLEHGLTLDAAGFELIKHRSTLSDWAAFQEFRMDLEKECLYPNTKAFDAKEWSACLAA